MSDLAFHQRLGDDADHPPAAGQHRISQRAHQADARAAIHQLDLPPRQQRAERFRLRAVYLTRTKARAAEHTHAHAANDARWRRPAQATSVGAVHEVKLVMTKSGFWLRLCARRERVRPRLNAKA